MDARVLITTTNKQNNKRPPNKEGPLPPLVLLVYTRVCVVASDEEIPGQTESWQRDSNDNAPHGPLVQFT